MVAWALHDCLVTIYVADDWDEHDWMAVQVVNDDRQQCRTDMVDSHVAIDESCNSFVLERILVRHNSKNYDYCYCYVCYYTLYRKHNYCLLRLMLVIL